MTEQKSYEGYGIVELMGHSQIAGRISEQSIEGSSFVRVDVPAMAKKKKNNSALKCYKCYHEFEDDESILMHVEDGENRYINGGLMVCMRCASEQDKQENWESKEIACGRSHNASIKMIEQWKQSVEQRSHDMAFSQTERDYLADLAQKGP